MVEVAVASRDPLSAALVSAPLVAAVVATMLHLTARCPYRSCTR